MNLLTAGEIAQMRETLEDSFSGTAVIQSGTIGDDSGGGGTATWSAAGTVECRVASLSGAERELGNRLAEDAKWVLTLPQSATVTTDSRFVITGAGHNGTFEALAIRAWTPSLSTRIECREVV
jgi:hypothetical protein